MISQVCKLKPFPYRRGSVVPGALVVVAFLTGPSRLQRLTDSSPVYESDVLYDPYLLEHKSQGSHPPQG